MEDFTLRKTPARRAFKSLLGQANHLLITQLVGLAAVEAGDAHCPPDLATSWNPQDVRRSAERSREFAIRGTLVATCDALDTYLRLLNRKPKVLNDPGLIVSFDDKGRRLLATRMVETSNLTSDLPGSPALALVRFAVAWRNRVVHYLDEDALDGALRAELAGHADEIRTAYQGVIVEEMLDRFERTGHRSVPTFKETTAFVRSAHQSVEVVDEELLRRLDGLNHLHSALELFFKGRDDRIVKTWGKELANRRRRVRQLLLESGYSPAAPDDLVHVTADQVEAIAEWDVARARDLMGAATSGATVTPAETVS